MPRPSELLWRMYFWNEILLEVFTWDNTQKSPEDLPKTHAGWLNQLIDDGSDTHRLRGSDNFLCLVQPDGSETWTVSDDENVLARTAVGTEFVQVRGMQFYLPSWHKLSAYARNDPDFPNADARDALGERERDLFDSMVQHEKIALNRSRDLLEQERQALRDLP